MHLRPNGNRVLLRSAIFAAMANLTLAGAANAQFNLLHTFQPSVPQDAFYPNGLIQGSDGHF